MPSDEGKFSRDGFWTARIPGADRVLSSVRPSSDDEVNHHSLQKQNQSCSRHLLFICKMEVQCPRTGGRGAGGFIMSSDVTSVNGPKSAGGTRRETMQAQHCHREDTGRLSALQKRSFPNFTIASTPTASSSTG